MILISFFQFGNTYVEGVAKSGFDWIDFSSKLITIAISVVAVITARASLKASNASLKTSQASLNLSESLARNYDVKKLFIRNQFEAVSDLIKELNNITLVVAYSDNRGGSSSTTINLGGVDLRMVKNYENNNKQLSFTNEFEDNYKIIKYASHVFIPTEIAKELNKLYVSIGQKENDFLNPEHFTFVSINNNAGIDFHFRPSYIRKPFPNHEIYLTLSSFLKQIFEIKNSVLEWMKKYDIDEANIRT